ncbi:MAG: dicarboxylate/amino acid:cation symporter [Clostridiales bacterium]|nr:dicarboxylate/amino acid:cation symporter [Clostridiales bacterium]
MKNFIKNYATPLILLLAIILGGILGAIMGPQAKVLEPLGQIFLNLIFTIIVPLVFFSITSSIANMGEMKRLGKILVTIVAVFAITAILSALISIVGVYIVNPIEGVDEQAIESILADNNSEISEEAKALSLPEQLVKTVTVNDFSQLFSKNNMLQLIIISVIFGISVAMVGDKAKVIKDFLSAGSEVMMKMVKIIMYYGPLGLACYFASIIGQLGTQILAGYLKVFLLYIAISIIYYFVFFSIYAYVAAGKTGFRVFWRNSLAPAVTALATCSSAASIPVNLQAAKKMGIPDDIAETVIPLGVSTHKDGSVIGGVLKVVFLFGLFGKDYNNIPMLLSILIVSLLVGAVMGAIPGGGMIGEMLILSIYGFPPSALPVIAVISTIIDAPATLLNSSGNTVCAMMVARFVDGKKWLGDKYK